MQRQKPFLRAFFFLFLLACLLTGLVGTVRVPANAAPPLVYPATSVLISEFRTRGPNGGNDEFVELYNPTANPINITGWKINRSNNAGALATQATIPAFTLQPAQHYLIANNAAGGYGGSVPADLTYGTGITDDGGIALLDSANTIIDQVGMSTGSFYKEGTTLGPLSGNSNQGYERRIGGINGSCQDDGNNSTDFTLINPSDPQNSSSPTAPCGTPTSTPSATDTATSTNTPTNTSTPSQTFTPSNTPIFSLTPSLTPTPSEVIISEVAWMGTGASINDEWIELYNTRSTPINLTGWRLVNATGSVDIVINGVIPANGFFLLERAHELTVSDAAANQIYTGVLGNANDYLILSLPSGAVMDTANTNGGAWPAGTGSPDLNSMERVVTGGVAAPDTDIGWISNTNPATWTKHDARGTSSTNYLIHGTPGYANWAFMVTPTGTTTNTSTPTRTLTPTITPTSLPAATSIVISEFRTVGPNGGNDEFIELYNPIGSAIAIGGWTLRKSTGCGTTTSEIATIPATVTLAAKQHYLIKGSAYSGSVTADQSGSGTLGALGIANDGGIALLDSGGAIIDQVGLCSVTTYKEGTALTSLTTNVNRGYDRKASSSGVCADSNNNAADFFLRSPSDPQNTSTIGACGIATPTPTATSRTPTPRPTATRTPTPRPPPPLIAINEFVPRPGHDWNNDGIVNVGDEFIELLNHGVIPVSLSGYTLDDEVNIGSTPYPLPAITLQPGERIVFYGSQTGLLLSDGGDGVRLLKPNGQLGDAYNYTVVRYPDQSYCRLPDNGGLDDWNEDCFPTPGLKNARGSGAVSPPVSRDEELLCPLADTMPSDFILAECPLFGNIWSRYFWDKEGWFGEMIIPNVDSQWDVFVD